MEPSLLPMNVNALILSSGHMLMVGVKSVLKSTKQKFPVETILSVLAILDLFGMSSLKLVFRNAIQ